MQRVEFSLKPAGHRPLFAVRYRPPQTPWGTIGLVHGLGDHSGRFQSLAEFLVHRGLEVLCYDQRGHGRTGGSMPPFQILADDIDVLVQELLESGVPTFLFGQSLGGGLVIHHALTKAPPVHGIVAGSPLLRTTEPPPSWKLIIGRTLGRLFPNLCLSTSLNPQHLSHDLAEVEAYSRDPLVRPYVSAALGISMLIAGQQSLANAGVLKRPLLIMHGTEDKITAASASEQFSRSCPNHCELKLWPGLYHDLHLEVDRSSVLNYAVEWMHRRVHSPV